MDSDIYDAIAIGTARAMKVGVVSVSSFKSGAMFEYIVEIRGELHTTKPVPIPDSVFQKPGMDRVIVTGVAILQEIFTRLLRGLLYQKNVRRGQERIFAMDDVKTPDTRG